MPQHADTVPLRSGNGVHAFLCCICVCSYLEALVRFLWVTTGYSSILVYSRFQANELLQTHVQRLTWFLWGGRN